MFIDVQNHKIHYTVEGDDAKPNIVMLPGWGSNIALFQKIQTHLAQKFKVYAMDLPGYGLSPAPPIPWSTENYAELIAAFINQLQITKPILFGHSLGGKIALYLSAKHLVTTQKLILTGCAGIKTKKTLQQYSKIYLYKLCKYIAQLPLLRTALESRLEAYRKKTGSQDYRNASGVMRATLVKLVNEDFSYLLPAINVPTLLLWGEKDTDTPLTSGKTMQQLIPQAKLVIFPNAGHFPFLDDFAKFINSLDDFLTFLDHASNDTTISSGN
jgi:pimeloyl-ACP methyl ester carboxylesterase